MTAEHGTHELTSLFYTTKVINGYAGFRPERLGRFKVLRVEVTDQLVKVITEGGTIRLSTSQVHVSHSPLD